MVLAFISAFSICFYSDLECQILRNQPSISKERMVTIARHVQVSADYHGFSAELFAAILMQESSYRLNVKGSGRNGSDYGIAQIHYKTAESYGFNKKRLLTDLEYSIKSGAEVLAWFFRTYKDREPNDWWLRFNVGTRKKAVKSKAAKEYKRKVNRWKR